MSTKVPVSRRPAVPEGDYLRLRDVLEGHRALDDVLAWCRERSMLDVPALLTVATDRVDVEEGGSMSRERKKSIAELLQTIRYLPNRTPEMALDGGVDGAFARVSEYRDGAIYVGHYSGSSEWERHVNGDEIVMALAGRTTIILRVDGGEERHDLVANDLVVVPRGAWHRFEGSLDLKVLAVTPQPTEHSLEDPDA